MQSVCYSVCQVRAPFTSFGQLLRRRCARKCIVDLMKVYIERSNMQVELIRFRKKYRLYSRSRSECVNYYTQGTTRRHQKTLHSGK